MLFQLIACARFPNLLHHLVWMVVGISNELGHRTELANGSLEDGSGGWTASREDVAVVGDAYEADLRTAWMAGEPKTIRGLYFRSPKKWVSKAAAGSIRVFSCRRRHALSCRYCCLAAACPCLWRRPWCLRPLVDVCRSTSVPMHRRR